MSAARVAPVKTSPQVAQGPHLWGAVGFVPKVQVRSRLRAGGKRDSNHQSLSEGQVPARAIEDIRLGVSGRRSTVRTLHQQVWCEPNFLSLARQRATAALSIEPSSTAPFMASRAAIRGRMCEARRGALLPRHGDELAARTAPHMKPFTPAPLAEAVRNVLGECREPTAGMSCRSGGLERRRDADPLIRETMRYDILAVCRHPRESGGPRRAARSWGPGFPLPRASAGMTKGSG